MKVKYNKMYLSTFCQVLCGNMECNFRARACVFLAVYSSFSCLLIDVPRGKPHGTRSPRRTNDLKAFRNVRRNAIIIMLLIIILYITAAAVIIYSSTLFVRTECFYGPHLLGFIYFSPEFSRVQLLIRRFV